MNSSTRRAQRLPGSGARRRRMERLALGTAERRLGALLLVSAPVPQRVLYFGDVKQLRSEQGKDKHTRISYWVALCMLLVPSLFLSACDEPILLAWEAW